MENKKTRKRKVFETENKHYSYGIENNYNIKIMRVSRWVKIDCIYVTEKSRLWEYTDRYNIGEDKKTPVLVFRYNNKFYALDQFMRFGYPVFFTDETGKRTFLSGYDSTDCYYPLQIEIDDCGEYVRLYRNLKDNEYKENGGMY